MTHEATMTHKDSAELAPGLTPTGTVYSNLKPPALIEEAIRRSEGVLTEHGAFTAITTPYTGRSPKAKFVVREADTENDIWWGAVNQEMSADKFDLLHTEVLEHLKGQDLFVQDLFGGADPERRVPVRFVTTKAWSANFVRNMFIRPTAEELKDFEPEFTVLHAPELEGDPERHGLAIPAFVTLRLSKKLVLIGGTRYAGEMKKSIFTVLNYVYPQAGILSMHCSANVGDNGESALFFGLSGTGKTTLSADSSRKLIGDDEHGWSDGGVYNFEGGCYAKVIRLSPEGEPEIYATTRRFGTILENVIVDPDTRSIDLDDDSITENTRASYPIHYIPNFEPSGQGAHPTNVVFLTADAFGVLPPVAKLSADQAMYHFLSGYTAKVAGTERGVTEPQATFSACFGAPFLPLHPTRYATLLGEKIARHGVNCWLINTGWTGGPFGVGSRMSLAHTRAIVNATLDGSLAKVDTRTDPIFGLDVPVAVRSVPDDVLDPRSTWSDKDAYDQQAKKLAAMFRDNFAKFEDYAPDSVREAGPKG